MIEYEKIKSGVFLYYFLDSLPKPVFRRLSAIYI